MKNRYYLTNLRLASTPHNNVSIIARSKTDANEICKGSGVKNLKVIDIGPATFSHENCSDSYLYELQTTLIINGINRKTMYVDEEKLCSEI